MIKHLVVLLTISSYRIVPKSRWVGCTTYIYICSPRTLHILGRTYWNLNDSTVSKDGVFDVHIQPRLASDAFRVSLVVKNPTLSQTSGQPMILTKIAQEVKNFRAISRQGICIHSYIVRLHQLYKRRIRCFKFNFICWSYIPCLLKTCSESNERRLMKLGKSFPWLSGPHIYFEIADSVHEWRRSIWVTVFASLRILVNR